MRKVLLVASFLAVAALAACSSDDSDDGSSGAAGAAGTGGTATGGTGGTGTGGTGGGAGTAGTGGGGGMAGTGGGAGMAGTGGGAGMAGSGGAAGMAGSGGGGGDECQTCGLTSCSAEATACLGVTGCMECLQGDDTACNADNLDEVDALGQCLVDNCAAECGLEAGLDCDAPATPATGGSCVTVSGTIECNPVTNDGCDSGAGEACDFNEAGDGYQCWDGPNPQTICAECSDTIGFCAGGLSCVEASSAGDFACAKYCCDDTDCGPNGYCDDTLGLPGDIGLCLM